MAEAAARSVTVSYLLGSAIIAAGVFFGMKALGSSLGSSIERAINMEGGSVDRHAASIERAATNIRISARP